MTSSAAPDRTVLILGANGRFGLAAAQAFTAAGWHVLAQVRRDAAAGMPASAVLVRAPLAALATGDALSTLPRPGVVVHAVNPHYTRWNEEALPAARAGIEIAERAGARFLLPATSTTSARRCRRASTRRRRSGRPPQRARSGSRSSASSKSAPRPQGSARR